MNKSKEVNSLLPTDKQARKDRPITRGVLDYFPLAVAEVARVSLVANQQHNPGQPMHWDRSKSTDHADCISRHLIERGKVDDDGLRHTAKIAWRALALLQEELEVAAKPKPQQRKRQVKQKFHLNRTYRCDGLFYRVVDGKVKYGTSSKNILWDSNTFRSRTEFEKAVRSGKAKPV